MHTLHYLVKRLSPLVRGTKGRIFLSHWIPLHKLDGESLDLTLMKLCEFTHLGIGDRDASILATMSKEGIGGLMAHDQTFKCVLEIDVIDSI